MSPAPGIPNNAEGANSWQGFGTEEPYGQATKNAALAGAAPLAGGRIASGLLAAGKRAQLQAQRPKQPAQSEPGKPVSLPPPPQPLSMAQTWAMIAAQPGAENYPAIQQMAALAQSGV